MAATAEAMRRDIRLFAETMCGVEIDDWQVRAIEALLASGASIKLTGRRGSRVEQGGVIRDPDVLDVLREANPSKLGSYTHPEDVGNELKELARSVARDAVEYIPWRKVDAVEDGKAGELILRLDCGHAVGWPEGSNTPAATRCLTCDPPTFRGRRFPMVIDEASPAPDNRVTGPDPRD